jgi:chromate transporter
MHRELVDERRWISESRFLHALNYCMVLPGPEAQQLATYIGWLMHRTWGGIVAGALFVLPSLVILIVLSWVYMAFGHVPAIAGVSLRCKACGGGARAARRLAHRLAHAQHPALWLIAALAFARDLRLGRAVSVDRDHRRPRRPRRWTYRAPRVPARRRARHHGGGARACNHRRRHAHARARAIHSAQVGEGRRRVPCTLGDRTGCARPDVRLGRRADADGWFFTKAALLTFGGAYAVLPYVYQGAVETYGWLAPTQMIDGLALGETTPGPLIMVVAFVGFVGAWSNAVFGADALACRGIAGATVATLLHLPAVVPVHSGGRPAIETTHGRLGFTAPLDRDHGGGRRRHRQILAAFFAWHVFWPRGFPGGIDAASVAIFIAAALVLFRTKLGVIPVIAACGAAGLALRLLA